MKQKYTPSLAVPVLWFIVTAVWIAHLYVDFQNGKEPDILDAAVICMSLICAVTNLIKYLKDKKGSKEK